MSTCCTLLKTYAASLCSSAFKYQMQIQCLYVFGSQRFDPKTWFMWQTRLSAICICDLFLFDCLCMYLPLLCMHKPLLGLFLEKTFVWVHNCRCVGARLYHTYVIPSCLFSLQLLKVELTPHLRQKKRDEMTERIIPNNRRQQAVSYDRK